MQLARSRETNQPNCSGESEFSRILDELFIVHRLAAYTDGGMRGQVAPVSTEIDMVRHVGNVAQPASINSTRSTLRKTPLSAISLISLATTRCPLPSLNSSVSRSKVLAKVLQIIPRVSIAVYFCARRSYR